MKSNQDKWLTKKKTKLTLKVLLIFFIIAIVFAILLIFIYKYYESLNKVELKKYPMYQYFSGIKVEYTGKLSFKKNGDIVKLEYDDVKIEADSTPIYYQNIKNQLFLPKNMAIVFPRLRDKYYKINYFSTIFTDGDASYLKENGKDKFLESSFLYDGDNLYVFLNDTEVNVCGTKYNLSELSYAKVGYQSDIELYDLEHDKYEIINECDKDVIATISGYSINLSTDLIKYSDGNKLLHKNIDNLKTYK